MCPPRAAHASLHIASVGERHTVGAAAGGGRTRSWLVRPRTLGRGLRLRAHAATRSCSADTGAVRGAENMVTGVEIGASAREAHAASSRCACARAPRGASLAHVAHDRRCRPGTMCERATKSGEMGRRRPLSPNSRSPRSSREVSQQIGEIGGPGPRETATRRTISSLRKATARTPPGWRTAAGVGSAISIAVRALSKCGAHTALPAVSIRA